MFVRLSRLSVLFFLLFGSLSSPALAQNDPVTEQETIIPEEETIAPEGAEIANPNSFQEWANICYELATKDPNQAISACQKAIDLDPKQPSVWINQGVAFAKVKRYDKAFDCYNQALSLKSNYPRAWYNLALSFMSVERYADARVALDQAVQIDDRYIEAWFNRAITLMKLGLYPETVATNNKIIDLYLKNLDLAKRVDLIQVLNLRAMAFAKLRQYEFALDSFDEALKYNNANPVIWYNKGLVLEEMTEYEQALQAYQKALEFNPSLTIIQQRIDGLPKF
jgi:tetratricopeptide (TPR) repeat protein